MAKTLFGAFFLVLASMTVPEALGQSQNSGINTADTHVAFDVTLQGQSNVALSKPVYDSSKKTTTANITLSTGPKQFHVEAGYDSNGGLVVNVYCLDAAADPTTSPGNDFSLIRFAKN